MDFNNARLEVCVLSALEKVRQRSSVVGEGEEEREGGDEESHRQETVVVYDFDVAKTAHHEELAVEKHSHDVGAHGVG
uniref:Uncharacterized protein n=1 Tax=Steinernema glaseri TaxID=37863 RepID=A0A1I7YKU3_9BILA